MNLVHPKASQPKMGEIKGENNEEKVVKAKLSHNSKSRRIK